VSLPSYASQIASISGGRGRHQELRREFPPLPPGTPADSPKSIPLSGVISVCRGMGAPECQSSARTCCPRSSIRRDVDTSIAVKHSLVRQNSSDLQDHD
jgi:hypothetical protein